MKDHPDDTRKVPAGKTRLYHAAAAMGRRRMASMGNRELKEHQRKAARARWQAHNDKMQALAVQLTQEARRKGKPEP